MQASSKVVEVDFIVVDAYSLYTAIVARPCLHALGAFSSTLYQKVKYLFGGVKLKKLLGVSPQLGSAWSLPSYISPKQSPRPLLKGAYSNQKLQYCPLMD